jgi:hypothetical protein
MLYNKIYTYKYQQDICNAVSIKIHVFIVNNILIHLYCLLI